jgi:hypothetical protein
MDHTQYTIVLGITSLELESIHSPFLSLTYALDAGPRLVRLGRTGRDENLLGAAPTLNWRTVNGMYRTLGGHRLWHAPQVDGRSDVPDDQAVGVQRLEDGVRLVQAVEAPTGICKEMEVRLFDDRPGLEIIHRLTNRGVWAIDLAAWAITQFPLGGVAEVPLPVRPAGSDTNWPTRPLVFWDYSRMDDPRLVLEAGRFLLRGDARLPIFKIGAFCSQGWISYTREGVTLRRRFTPQPALPHTDQGCNVELFVSDQTIELEVLGPLTHLEPGQTVEHREEWNIF